MNGCLLYVKIHKTQKDQRAHYEIENIAGSLKTLKVL